MTRPRTEEEFERIREQLDDEMLANPVTAHLVRSAPLSAKHKAGLRAAKRKPPIAKTYDYAKRRT